MGAVQGEGGRARPAGTGSAGRLQRAAPARALPGASGGLSPAQRKRPQAQTCAPSGTRIALRLRGRLWGVGRVVCTGRGAGCQRVHRPHQRHPVARQLARFGSVHRATHRASPGAAPLRSSRSSVRRPIRSSASDSFASSRALSDASAAPAARASPRPASRPWHSPGWVQARCTGTWAAGAYRARAAWLAQLQRPSNNKTHGVHCIQSM
jgi:hypothetical protein